MKKINIMKKTTFLTLLVFLILSTTLEAQEYKISEETFNNLKNAGKYSEALNYINEKSAILDNYENSMREEVFAYSKAGFGALKYQLLDHIKENKQNIEINWISYEEALEKQKTIPKKIIIRYIDVSGRQSIDDRVIKSAYENQFSNAELINYVDENFYAVKIESIDKMKDLDIKFPESFIEMKREREATRRAYEIENETRKEKKDRERLEGKEGVKIAQNYYMEDFLRDMMLGSLSKLIFIDEEGKYIHQFERYPNLKTLEYYLKITGSNKYKELKTDEEAKEYYNSLNSFENYYPNSAYFSSFNGREEYLNFINNYKKPIVEEWRNDKTNNIEVTSKCLSTYYDSSKTLVNVSNCSSTVWLKNLPIKTIDEETLKGYEFDFNFSITQDFKNVTDKFGLQVMLGNSPKGYTWLGVDSNGKFHLSYRTDKGYTDILTLFNADRIHYDKPNHIKFVWFPNGNYYLKVNSYDTFGHESDTEIHKTIPLLGVSNRIVFYSNIKFSNMTLKYF